jgi:hypothetical protein
VSLTRQSSRLRSARRLRTARSRTERLRIGNDPLDDRRDVVDRRREWMLGREPILDSDHGAPAVRCEDAADAVDVVDLACDEATRM